MGSLAADKPRANEATRELSFPSHWTAKRLKYQAMLLTEKAETRQRPVGLENIDGWTGKFIPTNTEYQGDGVSFDRNDVLFGKLRPYLAKVWLADSAGEAVGDFHVLRPLPGTSGRFLAYHMLNPAFIRLADSSTFGAKKPRVGWDFMANTVLPAPPFQEQELIASFLDRETSKIDALVSEQRWLIALLKEKRQAVISHAVTKGLNPAVPMKPSGIPWLGDVPEHWEVVPLKALYELKHGYAFDGTKFSASGEYVLMNPGNFCERGGFRHKNPEKYYEGDDLPEEVILQSGRLLVAMTE